MAAAEAGFLDLRALRGAEAPLFHGIARVRAYSCEIKVKSKSKVKGSGQECPLHTSRGGAARVELVPFPIPAKQESHFSQRTREMGHPR